MKYYVYHTNRYLCAFYMRCVLQSIFIVVSNLRQNKKQFCGLRPTLSLSFFFASIPLSHQHTIAHTFAVFLIRRSFPLD